MDLCIKEISFSQFRNYASFSLENIGGLTVFVGPNATGKTNVVEGIQLLTAHASFRNATAAELVSWGAQQARLAGRFASDVRSLEVSETIKPGQRTFSLNGKKKSAADMQGILPSVAFSPDDLLLIKGPQSGKRAAVDLLGCQLSRAHRIIKRDYEKLIRHKNALLREGADPVLLASVNDMIVPTAVELCRYRQALFSNLVRRISHAYASLACEDETMEAVYVPSWVSAAEKDRAAASPCVFEFDKQAAFDVLERALAERGPEERLRRKAVVGPHADRFEFFVDGRNASQFASQGQQRSLVLAWKIAEVELVREIAGVKPVLLLDDVMSELDSRRRRALVELLHQDIQTFITATDMTCFDDDITQRARVVDLSEEPGRLCAARRDIGA